MKRALLLTAIALGIVVWEVNWRLNHPPVNDADRKVRALFQDTQEADVTQETCQLQRGCISNTLVTLRRLNRTELDEMLSSFRLQEDSSVQNLPRSSVVFGVVCSEEEIPRYMIVTQTKQRTQIGLFKNSQLSENYLLNPRFERRFRSYLDTNLPSRIRP